METIGKLALALCKAQAAMRSAKKDADNPFFKSKYADLPAVIEACREALTSNELAVLQPVTADGSKVTVKTMLVHSSGESISEALTVVAKDASPQAIGSAITYARRYGLMAMVGVAADDDDDGEAAQDHSRRAAPRREAARKAEVPNQSAEAQEREEKSNAKALVQVASAAPVQARAREVWKRFAAAAHGSDIEKQVGFKAWAKRLLRHDRGSAQWTEAEVGLLEAAFREGDVTKEETNDIDF